MSDAGTPTVSTVLLLHAGIVDSRMWKPHEVLEAAGTGWSAPDLRGFGERRLEPAPFSYVRDAEALLDGPGAVVGIRSADAWRSSWRFTGGSSSNVWS